MSSSAICGYLQSMEEHKRPHTIESWNHTIFTAESQISVSRLNRITYGWIAPVIISVGVIGDVLTVATADAPTPPPFRHHLHFTHVSVVPMIMWLLDIRLCSKSSAFYYAHVGFPLANALMGASVWIVVFLTFSQYMAVCQPFHQGFLRKRRMCFWLFALAYIFSFCIYAPWATKKTVHQVPPGLLNCPYVICDRKIEPWFQIYEWIREFLTRVFPFLLVAYLNAKILITYKSTKKDRMKRLAHTCKTKNGATEKSEQEERRLFALLFAIIVVFFVCTIPAAPLTIFVADDRAQNLTFQIIRATINLMEFTKFALNFYFYCLINPDIRRICIQMIQCQPLGKPARSQGPPRQSDLRLHSVRSILIRNSTKSTIRGFAGVHDDFSRRSSQRHIDDDYRRTIETKVHRSASLLSAGQYYCETPSEFDQLTRPSGSDFPSVASRIVHTHAGAPSPTPSHLAAAHSTSNYLLAPPK
ncbi:G-PROTEIN-RECEP-F1-2 domain-containing protein [Aphelenchoides fujianensis]|nr:G-PROTEIN-RECEP-F1-2 domain-containing protein [Aphelenchoides fujianensis]